MHVHFHPGSFRLQLQFFFAQKKAGKNKRRLRKG
jgi:hypothetical protein